MRPACSQLAASWSLLAALCLASCRGQGPEAGLDPALFEQASSALTLSARGEWFVVAPEPERSQPLAVITYKDDRKLFYTLPRGRRAMELLPLSPVPQSWFVAAMDCGCAQIALIDDPQGVRLTDRVGVADGAGRVVWLGPAPRAAVQAVFMPPALGNAFVPLRSLIVADGFVTQEGTIGGADVPAGSIVIADGDVRAEADIRVVALDASAPALKLGDSVKISAQPEQRYEPFEPRYARTGQVLGRRVGADVLLTRLDRQSWRVQLVEPSAAMVGAPARLAPAIAEEPLEVEDERELGRVMRGVLAVRRGHPLTAYVELDPALISIEGGSQAALLRVEELLGAAHWTQWMRAGRMDGKTHLQAPDFYYMARAMLFERALQSGDRLSKSALASFNYWSETAGALGKARSWALLAEIARRRGHSEDALIAAKEAARLYSSAGDVLRAADLEMFAAQLSLVLGKPDEALRLVEMARSRYYHGHFVYGCALAELAMAELHSAAGRSAQASEFAGYALKRMQSLSEPIGINRAQIVAALLQLAQGQDRRIELEEGLARARALRDPEGAARAAAALVNLGGALPRDRVWPFGAAIIEGLPSMQQQLASAQVQRALATLCAQGLPQSAEAAQADALQLRGAQIACQEVLSAGDGADSGARGWLEDGYRNIQLQDAEMARLRSSQLADLLTDSLTARTPQQAAEIWLYRAVVASAIDKNPAASDAALEQAVTSLTRHLDPALASAELAKSAALMIERGQRAIGQRLYQRALALLIEQRKEVEALDVAFALLDVQHGARDQAAMTPTLRAAEALAPAGPRGDEARARLLLYRAAASSVPAEHVQLRAEALTRAERLPPAPHVALLLDDARLARRDLRWDEAGASLTKAALLIGQMPEELVTSLPVRRQLAQVLIGQAEIAAHQGRYTDALTAASQAERRLLEDPSPPAQLDRIGALRLIAQLAVTGEAASSAKAELLIIAGRAPVGDDRVVVAQAWRALIALALYADDRAEAQAARLRVQQLGLSAAVATLDAACLSAELESGERAEAARASCAAGQGEQARSARIDAALAASGDQRAKLAKLDALTLQDGPAWSARQRVRVARLIRAARGEVVWREQEAKRLRAELAKIPAGDLMRRAQAADALITYLLDAGQTQQARATVEQERASLMQGGEESATLLACSEVLLGIAELAPLDAQVIAAYQALLKLAPSEQRIVLKAQRTRASYHIALGQLGRARLELNAALSTARLAKDATAEREIVVLIQQLYYSP